MAEPITEFRGQYRFLSNFFPSLVVLADEGSAVCHTDAYPSVEHAYQAAKTEDPEIRRQIRTAAGPSEAKRLGKACKKRDNWEQIKERIMLNLLRQKFSRQPLKGMLITTGDARLIEGNSWGDTYWGVCRGVGKNRLGHLLMQVRDEIK